MLLFLDSANLSQIKHYEYLIHGVTTTPAIIDRDFGDSDKFITQFRNNFPKLELHIEALGTSPEQVIDAITRYTHQPWFDEQKIVFKVPITPGGLAGITQLKKTHPNIRINLHLAFSARQAIISLFAEPAYIAPLIGRYSDSALVDKPRLRGTAQDPGYKMLDSIVKATIATKSQTLILASSMRTSDDVVFAATCGAQAVTVPPAIMQQMFLHPMTDKAIKIFEQIVNG